MLSLCCFCISGTAQGKSGAFATAEAYDARAILSRAWDQSSEVASATWGNMSEYLGGQGSMVQMAGVGAFWAVVLACTLFGISRVMDKEPYLFNTGKLGRLEGQSSYNTSKKCC